MHTFAKVFPTKKPVLVVAVLTFMAGVSGMVMSFAFLASANRLDVTAGAAGFIAGAVLAAAGLISISLQSPRSLDREPTAPTAGGETIQLPSVDVDRWLEHFHHNREGRPEPDWNAPMTLSSEVVCPLVRSLEQFQLGDGGGPAYLIAHDREQFLSASAGTRALVDLWFAEEREHARLLRGAVTRFGGRCIDGHWSFTAFCLSRQWFGVRFELTVLVLTEIVSTVYYRLLHRHGADVALRSMCRLILRDEIGHVAFHRDRLARAARTGHSAYGKLWAIRFRLLGFAAATMLWVNHAPGLRALGASRAEFYREVWGALTRFIDRLRRESQAEFAEDLPAGEDDNEVVA
jgi:hypothetical protein